MYHFSTSKFLEATLLLCLLICLVSATHAQTATWSSTASSSDWNTAANWVEGVAPTTTSSVVINTCSKCPELSSNVTVGTLSVNSGGGIHLQSYTISSTTAQIKYATVNSAGGRILAGSISEVYRSTFNGPITFEKYGPGARSWSGGNIFNGPVILTVTFVGTEISNNFLRTGYIERDIFNQEVVINYEQGYGLWLGANLYNQLTLFKSKVTFNNNCSGYHGGFQRVRCEGEVVINSRNASSSGFQYGELLGPITVYYYYAGDWSGTQVYFENCTFQAPVIINNTNTTVKSNNLFGIVFGKNNGTCTFSPTASLQIGPNGFYRGDLLLERCIFQNNAATALDLSFGPSSTHRVGRLIVGTGTSFSGSFEAKSPHILLNGATFNQEATFTKTGAGINNSVGGNTFKKKVTITNQADASSAMNLATQVNDIIKY